MQLDIFNSFIWKTKINYDDKEKLIKNIEEIYNKNPNKTPEGWDCKIHSSFKNKKQNLEIIPKNLIKLIEEKSNEFLDTHLKLMKLKGKYYMSNIWYNAYKNDQYQEIHHHGDSLFSGCYYLKFDKEIHHSTTFYNPNYDLNYLLLEDNSYFSFTPDCEEDDLIFFPSFLKHGTKAFKQKCTDKIRITISFNICNSSFLNNKNFLINY